MSYSSDDLYFLGLMQSRGVGYRTLRDLGGPDGIANARALGNLPSILRNLAGDGPTAKLERDVLNLGESLAADLEGQGVKLMTERDFDYPQSFRFLTDDVRPLWLFYKGKQTLLDERSVAVVGTREPTDCGTFLTQFVVSMLREFQVPIVSGLARGIDAVAHSWAIRSGVQNISVLGTGILKPYPAKNLGLAEAIVAEGGVIVSEYAPYAGPSSEQFVWRNRLQAAISCCVIAPEWQKASGTAHTIRFAQRFGRPTINVEVTGMPPPQDGGRSDRSFSIPSQHNEIRDFVAACIQGNIRTTNAQKSLF